MTVSTGAIPKPTYLVRATVVATLSDGSRVSWVIDGDETSQLDTKVAPAEPENDLRVLGLLKPSLNPRTNLMFAATSVPSYTLYMHDPDTSGAAEQAEIEKAPAAIEDGHR